MDIWAWVYRTQADLRDAGQGRLADLIDAIPTAALEDENAEVDALVPEAVGLARALNLPWVEIFVRHWHMQARGGGFSVLDDAVELLEFSHREQHVACPQSVCTVQDLAIAYAGADGPGFAQERLDVATETLARIDPSWMCFDCIVDERASALVDARRAQEAIDFIARSRAERAASGRDDEASAHESTEAWALLELGRTEEAHAVLEAAERRDPREDTFGRSRRLWRTLALLELGRAAEARELLLPVELVRREPKYALRWVRAVTGLVAAGEHANDWRTGADIEDLLAILVERGRAWDAVRAAVLHGRLALERGARATAVHAAALGREQAGRLRDPARGAAELEALERALESADDDAGHELPETPRALVQAILADEEDPDPEQHAERLAAGARRWPDSLEVAEALARALAALGRPADAAAALRAFAERHPDDPSAWTAMGHAAIAGRDGDTLAEAVERLEPRSAVDAAWLRALMANAIGDHEGAAGHARRVVDLDPDARNARRLWIHSAERAGDWEVALEQTQELIARVSDEDAEDLHWTRLTAATALGDWAVVRASARRVGMPVDEGEDPIDEPWAPLRLSFGPREIVAGLRTGPATARVLGIAPPGSPQRAGAIVLFDGTPLDEGDGDTPMLVRVIETLEPSTLRAHAFDAVDAGDEAWLAFRERIEAEGWLLNSFRYAERVPLEHEGEPCRGLYGYVAVPEDVEPARVHARLGELAAPYPKPMVWPALAAEAGDEAAARTQRGVAAAIGLIPD